MPIQLKFLLKFKYENVVRLAFQKKFYSKTRMDGHITIREKSVWLANCIFNKFKVHIAATSTTLRIGWAQPPKPFPGHNWLGHRRGQQCQHGWPRWQWRHRYWTMNIFSLCSRADYISLLLTNFVFHLTPWANYESSFVLLTLLQLKWNKRLIPIKRLPPPPPLQPAKLKTLQAFIRSFTLTFEIILKWGANLFGKE